MTLHIAQKKNYGIHILFLVSFGILLASTSALSCLSKKSSEAKVMLEEGETIVWSKEFTSPRSPAQLYSGNNANLLDEATLLSCITANSDDNIWAATIDGDVYHFDGIEWLEVTRLDLSIESIYTNGDNQVWVGGQTKRNVDTSGNAPASNISFFDGNDWTIQASFIGIDSNIKKIDGFYGNELWAIGDYGKSLLRFDGTSWSVVYSKGGGSGLGSSDDSFLIEDIHIDEAGIPLVLDDGKRVHYLLNGSWELMAVGPAIGEDIRLLSISGNLSERLWICGSANVNAVDENSPLEGILFESNGSEWNLVERRPQGAFRQVISLNAKEVFVTQLYGTIMDIGSKDWGTKMARYSGGTWTEEGYLPQVFSTSMVVSNDGSVWMCSTNAIYKGSRKGQ